jgi:hypothetical protein
MRVKAGRSVTLLVGALVVCVSQSQAAQKAAPPAPDKIFETNVTKDLNISSGEPQIAVDPTDAHNVAIIEFASGSAAVPAWTRNTIMEHEAPGEKPKGDANPHLGRLQLSKDGGNTWTVIRPPAYDPEQPSHPGGGDPMIAYGPDGTLYAADCTGQAPKSGNVVLSGMDSLHNVKMFIVASTDGGKTFTQPQQIETPRDRPWLKVDQSTGTVYTASTGTFNPKTKAFNQPGAGMIMDRWLTAWKPHLAGHSEPRRMGGPDFSAAGSSTMSAANGILAVAFMLGTPEPGGMGRGAPTSVPASLQGLIKDGTKTCSVAAPCVFFETSADEGQTWSRHQVPLPAGVAARAAHVAADPGRPGRYAVGLLSANGKSLMSVVTDDYGESWSAPATIPETVQGDDFKQWMDYAPNGVLGYMWKKKRDDLPPPPPMPPMTSMADMMKMIGRMQGPPFDVYAAISCDGGKSWLKPVRVNAEASPAGPNGFDDLSYIALDNNNAHLVWGDRRNVTKVKNAPSGMGGIQVYYGRVPFTAVSNGAVCGRLYAGQE